MTEKYINFIKFMLQPGFDALTKVNQTLFESGKSLTLFQPEFTFDDDHFLGELVIRPGHKLSEYIKKDIAKQGFSWKFDEEMQSFKSERLKSLTNIKERWKYGLTKRKLNDSIHQCNKNSLFIPNIGIPDIQSAEAKQNLLLLSQEIHDFVLSKDLESKESFFWQDMLKANPISGFGVDAQQVYIKSGITLTHFHDELGHSSAVNYMKKKSRGVALWIGLNLEEWSQYLPKETMFEWFTNPDVNGWMEQIASVCQQCIDKKQKVPELQMVWQTPGSLIYSPQGGYAHLVLTCSEYVEQLAMNVAASASGMKRCLEFWAPFRESKIEFNSGLATEHVIPCCWLHDSQHMDLGEDIYKTVQLLKQKLKDKPETEVEWIGYNKTKDEISKCIKCNNTALWAFLNKTHCETCFMLE